VIGGILRSGHHSSGGYYYVIVGVVGVLVIVRLVMRLRKRARRKQGDESVPKARRGFAAGPEWVRGGVTLVAYREIRERLRSRIYRIGTLIVLVVVAVAVVVPVLTRGGGLSTATVGVVGPLSAPLRATITHIGPTVGAKVSLEDEPSVGAAESLLRSGKIDVAIVDAHEIIVNQAISATDTSTTAIFVRAISIEVGLQDGLVGAGISPLQAVRLANPKALPVKSLQAPSGNSTARNTGVYGLILMFVLLSQYGAWILMGVVEEKSSRVVEVLLSTLRPVQLLAGKVIGIGLMAITQGLLVVGVALGLGAAVGSDLVKGTAAPLVVLSVLVWLILGYAFYCWVYAAAGSLAERQEHLQTLAFPLQLPILFGYIVSLSSIGSTSPSLFLRVLAFFPPTAPFAMSALVAMGKTTWWQFVLSVGLTLAATAVVIRVASAVYARAVLRTGRRVKLGEVFGSEARL
jgi:ABC-2 type transport system permease protein